MYEFQYRPSFSPEMKPSTVVGDHGDEVYSIFGASILRGNGTLQPVSLRSGSLGSSLAPVALSSFLLLS